MEAAELETPRPEVISRLAKDEMNLAEFPITLLSDRVPDGQNEIIYQDQIYDSSLDRTIDRKLTITASEKYGLPTALDDDVLLALIQLSNRANGFTSREVSFTRYELSEILQWPVNGQNYDRLVNSLRRWMNVTLEYENAWWNKKQMAWTTTAFHILDNFEVNGTRGRRHQGELFASSITWNKIVFASFEAGYLKSIDYDLYISLKSQVAKRLYRFLSKRFYRRDDFTMSLRDLAFAHVGISRNYKDAGKIKEKLQGGLDELETIGFLMRLKREDRYFKIGKEWTIRLVAGKKVKPTTGFISSATAAEPKCEPSGLAKELADRGVSRTSAEALVRDYGEEKVGTQIEIFDWYAAKKPGKIEDPAAWLVSAIRMPEGHAAPKGFKSKSDLAREKEAKKAADQKAEETRKLKADQKAYEAHIENRIKTDWQKKTPEQQAHHDRMAIANATESEQQDYHSMPHQGVKEAMLKGFRDAYSRKLLLEFS